MELVAHPSTTVGTEREWQKGGAPDAILDNLIADGKCVPMIVVLPNGRAQKGVPHIWHVDSGKHDLQVWKNDLYLFSQRIFR